MNRLRDTRAFTLIETMLAVGVIVIALAMSMTGFGFIMKAQRQKEVQEELDVDVQKAMELLKADLRLSSLDMMYFYPVDDAKHTAVSFPLARDDDADGAVDLDGDGHIIWDRTLIYHVWESSPNELRITTFDPRDNSLDDAQRQAQLESVVAHGNGEYALNGRNASTRKVFSNLFTWSIRPKGAIYDAYAPTLQRDIGVNLGSFLMDTGSHTFRFVVVGKDSASTGYHVGVDSLFASPCRYPREGEALLPATEYTGPQPVADRVDGGSWSGNRQLYFSGDAVNNSFSLSLDNDRWQETNFQGIGDVCDNTAVAFNWDLNPEDYVVTLFGNTNVWSAAEQTGDTNGGRTTAYAQLRGDVIRVLLRGVDMYEGGFIHESGRRCRVAFRSGMPFFGALYIQSAAIAECRSSEVPTMDALSGSSCALTFGGSTAVMIGPNQTVWSDLAAFSVECEKSYLVTFQVVNGPYRATAWQWRNPNAGATNSFVIPLENGAAAGDVADATWSAKTNVYATNVVYAVSDLFVTHPAEGSYTSQILDTQVDRPMYTALEWSADTPTGTALSMKMRTGDQADMVDAPAWSNVVASSGSGQPVAVSVKRYVQFRADMQSSTTGEATPILKDVTIKWTGESRVVDIGGTFTKGPDYGQFELFVDGQRLRTGMLVDLELFRDIRAFNVADRSRITSAAAIEVSPRNTGL